jgi:DNA repair exonuclease SbcCD ATPase subunit
MSDEPQKDDEEKVDVYNASQRTYGAPDGQTLEPGKTIRVSKAHAESLIKAYPNEVVSPDSYRAPGAKSGAELIAENKRLAAELEVLKQRKDFNAGTEASAQLLDAQKATADALAQVADLQKQLDAAKAQMVTVNNSVTQESEQITALTNQVNALQVELGLAKNGAADAQATVTATQAKLDEATAKIAELEQSVTDLQTQLATEKTGAQSFVDSVQAKITAYNAALDSLPAGAIPPHFTLDQTAQTGA